LSQYGKKRTLLVTSLASFLVVINARVLDIFATYASLYIPKVIQIAKKHTRFDKLIKMVNFKLGNEM